MDERSCTWMSGPKDASLHVPAVKWWLAISRDILTKDYQRRMCKHRPPVSCDRTPSFTSPISHKPS